MKKKVISYVTVCFLLIMVLIISTTTGSIQLGFLDLIQGLITGNNEEVRVIQDLRFPRIIIAIFAGAALAVAGALFQAVMRNPLADAGIIGISSGAGFTSILAISFFPTLYFWSPLFAFMGGALACFLVYSLSWKSGLSPVRLILVGVAINAVFSGLGETFNYRGSYTVTSISPTTTSTLSMKSWQDVEMMLIFSIIGLALAFLLAKSCNLLVLQDKTTRNLGVSVTKLRIIVSAVAVLLAAVSTAIAGLIAFIGLLVPHIARRLVGTEHKVLLPFTALAGGLLLLLADTLGRTLIAPNEIPASIIMSIIGGPFLIFLLRRGDK
ncbi:FecCD family ABC transporter permease [Alkalihalobacillus trypoxylicola]|uniref:Probable heme-iron transport system permease protein IsdF n=1 Tax=Alkalihalobacillus trypoxylicola TaxID=519424 RepID=A0A161QIK1_9BACI|nr:iron ABC transporter permease [Alkalihalobacillus trypoxylicola]KYG29338.1 ABC transporter permease [Alkalihalobacillus trypoxylicola]